MFKKGQFKEVKWVRPTKEWYLSKGYIFTKIGDSFTVKAEDLSRGSKQEIVVVCDYCGKEFKKAFCAYIKQRDDKYGDCCFDCKSVKQKKIFLDKYGVENPSLVKEFQDKRKRTFQQKYGVDNPSLLRNVQEKKKNTLMMNYGVDNPMKSAIVQNKAKETCLNKYGCEYSFQNEEIKKKCKQAWMAKYGVDNASKSPIIINKIKNTWMKKYGVENIMELEYFRNKILNSFVSNNKCPTSSLQENLYNMVKEIYKDCQVEENIPEGGCLLDIVLYKDGVKIDIEYDGWYWHKNKQEKDKRRNYYLLNKGYKIIRVRSNYDLPTVEQITNAVDLIIQNKKSVILIDLDI